MAKIKVIAWFAFFLSVAFCPRGETATITVCSSGCTHSDLQLALNASDAGDIIEIQDSLIYSRSGGYEWTRSGGEGNPIILRAKTGQNPTITASDNSNGCVLSITGSYLQIGDTEDDGTINIMSALNNGMHGINIGSGRHDNVVKYTTIKDIRSGIGIFVSASSYDNLIEGNTFDNIHYNSGAGGSEGSCIDLRGNDNIIRGNKFHRCSHDNIFIPTSSSYNNQILDNYFDNGWGHGIATDESYGGTPHHTLIEGNTFENIALSSDDHRKNCIQISGATQFTIRKNFFIRPLSRVFEINSYSGLTDTIEDIWIYNNTFYDIGWRGVLDTSLGVAMQHRSVSTGSYQDVKWYNNLLEKVGQTLIDPSDGTYCNMPFYVVWTLAYYNDVPDAGCGESGLEASDWNGFVLKNNNIRPYFDGAYRLDYDHTIYYVRGGSCGCEAYYSAAGVNGIGSASGNMSQDPMFIDPENGDFGLEENSPVIDKGIVVADPNADEGGWDQLDYAGNAPDIGAFEYGLDESGDGGNNGARAGGCSITSGVNYCLSCIVLILIGLIAILSARRRFRN